MVAEVAQWIAEAPRSGHDVEEAVVVKVFHNAAPGQAEDIQPEGRGLVEEATNVGVRGKDGRGNEMGGWHRVRIFAHGHIGDVEQPARG